MKAWLVVEDIWSIYLLGKDGDDDPFDGLKLETAQEDAILALFSHCSQHINGPRVLGDNRCHQISEGPLIFQLNPQHPIRIAFFYDAGRKMICTQVFRKAGGSGRTPAREIKRAIRLRQEYLDAVANGTLVVE